MMVIKEWFVNKEFTLEEKRAMNSGYDVEIIRETEKAVYANINTDFGKIRKWIPKSVLTNGTYVSVSDFNAEVDQEVEHIMFGKGIVLEVYNDMLKIDFNGEVKKILKEKRLFK